MADPLILMEERLERTSLVDLIVDRLRGEILSGRHAPGATLPPERELAAQYGVNRTSVKHALMKLEQAGLIEIRHGIGSQVVDFDASGGLELLEHLLVRAGSVDSDLFADVLELRVILGGAIAHLATQRVGSGGIRELDDVLDDMRQVLDDPAAVQHLDMEFFRRLAHITGNRALRLLLNTVAVVYLQHGAELRHAFAETQAVLGGLESVRAAVASGNTEAARAAAEAYLRENSDAILRRPARGKSRPSRRR